MNNNSCINYADDEETRFLNTSNPQLLKCIISDNKDNNNKETNKKANKDITNKDNNNKDSNNSSSSSSNNTTSYITTSNNIEASSNMQLNDTARTVIKLILNTLVLKAPNTTDATTDASSQTTKPPTTTATSTTANISTTTSSTNITTSSTTTTPSTATTARKHMLVRSSVLRLLSEVVKSYSLCGALVTQHTYKAGQSELVQEVRGSVFYLSVSIFLSFFFFLY